MDNPDPRQPADPLGDDGGTTRIEQQRNQRLIERALAEYWEISGERRTQLIDRLFTIVSNPKANGRAVTSAARVLLTASKVNLESVTSTIKATEHEELSQRIAELEERIKPRDSDDEPEKPA